MKEKTVQIHFRATEKELQKYKRNARKCGLSLSEYLRKLADGYEPKPLPPLDYHKLMDEIFDQHDDLRNHGNAKYAELLVGILLDMQTAIAPGKVR